MLNWFIIDEIIKNGLKEDMNCGDITTDSIVDEGEICCGEVLFKEDGIVAGLNVMTRVFKLLDNDVHIDYLAGEGERVKKGQVVARIKGKTAAILKGERLALNLIQRMSGIATQANLYKSIVKDLPVKIVDTRKTTPGLRILEKYSVRIGGCHNHRFNLSDSVLIKDNHIVVAGGIKEAIKKVKDKVPITTKIEVEVQNLSQLDEALKAGADIIMLDNMDVKTMVEAVKITNKRAILEASGGITTETLLEIAKTGVDIISIGALTHSARALDISLNIIGK